MVEIEDRYKKALSRDDLSQWLVHFTKPDSKIGLGTPFDVLRNIIASGKVWPSKVESIIRHDPSGAACFYEVPPQNWIELIATNPNSRQPYGIIVHKATFWLFGGRPAIYTDDSNALDWPERHRYRLITTELLRKPHPIDWTHEREWRIRGELAIQPMAGSPSQSWWWPCVKGVLECQILYREFGSLHQIYVMDLGKVLGRNEILI